MVQAHPWHNPRINNLTDEQYARLTDIIGDASWCSDDECSCHQKARTARAILDGEEDYEVIDGK